ncbi:MAG TPA: flagellar protein FliT [Burkholderiaceae bacterium]|nr:flagellar protein FliT [Burkholderiaceae bacterium]
MALKGGDGADEAFDGRSCGLIQQYEKIALASRSMLEAAHLGNWDQVEEIAARCRVMIEKLKLSSTKNALGDGEKRRRIALLRSILNDDAQIRARAEPWLRDLEAFLGSSPQPRGRTP